MGEIWQVIRTYQNPTLGEALAAHLRLSVCALLLGIAIAIPLAIIASRSALASLVAVNISNVGRALPSLAVLALALPFLGLGFRPALLALTVLCIPPILINAAVGLREVDSMVVESARGMGLSNTQILTRIRLPIALPVIFAGVRTAAVQVVASATLATFIGGGGLGDVIIGGLSTNRTAVLLAGAIPVAVLAMLTELFFAALERGFTPRGLRLAEQRTS